MPAGQRCGYCRGEGHNLRTCASLREELGVHASGADWKRRAVEELKRRFRARDERIEELEQDKNDLLEQIDQQQSELADVKQQLVAAQTVMEAQDALIEAYAKQVEHLTAELSRAKAELRAAGGGLYSR